MSEVLAQNSSGNGNGNRNGSGNSKRTRQLVLLTAVLVLAGVAVSLYWFLFARFYEETDDAYVGGNVIQISSQVSGTVTAIKADDQDTADRLFQDLLIGAATNLARIADALTRENTIG